MTKFWILRTWLAGKLLMATALFPFFLFAADPITLGQPELLYTDAQMPFCMDGTMSTLVKNDSELYFYEYTDCANSIYQFHGPVSVPFKTSDGIKTHGNVWDMNGVSTTPWIMNYYKAPNGDLLGFCHCEDNCGTGPFSVGLAYSKDNGDHWKFCGKIVKTKTNITETTNVGGVPMLVVGEYFYVYFNDWATGPQVHHSVARAKVVDVVAAAAVGTVTAWSKYRNGDWQEDALTGIGDAVLPDSIDLHADAAYCRPLGKYLLTAWVPNKGLLLMFSSTDGVVWQNTLTVDSASTLYGQPYSCFADPKGSAECLEVTGDFDIIFPRKQWPSSYCTDDLYKVHVTVTDPFGSLTLVSIKAIAGSNSIERYDSTSIKAAASYSNGQKDTTIFGCTFVCLDTAIARVNSAGMVRGKQVGSARVVVSKRGMADTLTISITPSTAILDSLRMTPSAAFLNVSDSVLFHVMAYFHKNSTGFTQDVSLEAVWATSGGGTISNAGQYKSSGTIGEFIVTASLAGYTGITATANISVSVAFQYSLGFDSLQGSHEWYYQYGTSGSYTDMTWDGANARWVGNETYVLLWKGGMHPGLNTDAVLKWVAPTDGTVRITGTVRKSDASGGDGVSATIKNGTTTIWGPSAIAYNDQTGLSHDLAQNVTAGSALYFIVNNGGLGSHTNDGTSWDPIIRYINGTATELDNIPDNEPWLSINPNPFNPEIRLTYVLRQKQNTSVVIYNIYGTPVRSLVSGTQAAGIHAMSWNGRDDNGHLLSSGVYLVKLTGKDGQQIRKVQFIK